MGSLEEDLAIVLDEWHDASHAAITHKCEFVWCPNFDHCTSETADVFDRKKGADLRLLGFLERVREAGRADH